jgi:hypothetical protein
MKTKRSLPGIRPDITPILPSIGEIAEHMAVARDAARVIALGRLFTFDGGNSAEISESWCNLVETTDTFYALGDLCRTCERMFEKAAAEVSR